MVEGLERLARDWVCHLGAGQGSWEQSRLENGRQKREGWKSVQWVRKLEELKAAATKYLLGGRISNS